MQKIVSRKELFKKIGELAKNFLVIGPKELPGKGIFYQVLNNADDLYLGERFTVEPVKKLFLTPSECFFKGDFKGGSEVVEVEPLSQDKRIIFGVRPCEGRGLVLLDKVFDSEYKDNSYINRRGNTVIVGMSCQKPDKNCFCTSMGGSPVEGRGMDAVIFEVGEEFVIDVLTDKGKDVFKDLKRELTEKEKKSWEQDKDKRKDALERKIKVPESLDKIFESGYWGTVSSACLSCGVCTYLCPTCHCFDLVDEERRRLRCYDGCAFSDFTLEASGVNPRPTKKERYRQRVFHKFDYFKKNFGENLCVGCGRCIRYCPVKIDISEIVANALSEAEKKS